MPARSLAQVFGTLLQLHETVQGPGRSHRHLISMTRPAERSIKLTTCHPDFSTPAARKTRRERSLFVRVASSLSALNHPNVAPYYDEPVASLPSMGNVSGRLMLRDLRVGNGEVLAKVDGNPVVVAIGQGWINLRQSFACCYLLGDRRVKILKELPLAREKLKPAGVAVAGKNVQRIKSDGPRQDERPVGQVCVP